MYILSFWLIITLLQKCASQNHVIVGIFHRINRMGTNYILCNRLLVTKWLWKKKGPLESWKKKLLKSLAPWRGGCRLLQRFSPESLRNRLFRDLKLKEIKQPFDISSVDTQPHQGLHIRPPPFCWSLRYCTGQVHPDFPHPVILFTGPALEPQSTRGPICRNHNLSAGPAALLICSFLSNFTQLCNPQSRQLFWAACQAERAIAAWIPTRRGWDCVQSLHSSKQLGNVMHGNAWK